MFSDELIQHAINKAVDENAPRWNYIKAILRNWKEQEVKTLVDVATLDRRFEMSKKRNITGQVGSIQIEKRLYPIGYIKMMNQQIQKGKKTVQSIDEERERLQEVLNKYKS